MLYTFMQMANHKNETHQEEILQFNNILIIHIVQVKLMDSGFADISIWIYYGNYNQHYFIHNNLLIKCRQIKTVEDQRILSSVSKVLPPAVKKGTQ